MLNVAECAALSSVSCSPHVMNIYNIRDFIKLQKLGAMCRLRRLEKEGLRKRREEKRKVKRVT